MKNFEFSLETVLRYKESIYKEKKSNYARSLEDVNRKKQEIYDFNKELLKTMSDFDIIKKKCSNVATYRIYVNTIDDKTKIIEKSKEQLGVLENVLRGKKREMIESKCDVSKFEKLREHKYKEYLEDIKKASEIFIDEFVSHNSRHSELA